MKLIFGMLMAGCTWAQCSGYSFNTTATVHHAQVAANQSNFTVLVSGTWAQFKTVGNGGSVQNSSGFDICFANSGNTAAFSWDLETYVASTGQLIAHVGPMSLSSTVDTTFLIYYGNASISTFQGGSTGAAWDSNYAAIYHVGGSLTADYSANANTLTNNGGTATAGEIDGGVAVNGSTQYLNHTGASGLNTGNNARTISAWIKASSISGSANNFAAAQGTVSANTGFILGLTKSSGAFIFTTAGSANDLISGSTATVGTWYLEVGCYDGSGNLKLWVNGASSATKNITSTNTANSDIFVGKHTAGEFFAGSIDEVRYSNVDRCGVSGWNLTEYNNQSAPGTFLTLGFPSFAISPSTVLVNVTQNYTFTGTNTAWSSPTGLFTLSGGTGASMNSITVNSTTSATVNITSGSAPATLTITDTSTGATNTLSVVNPACRGYAYSATLTVAQVTATLANFPVVVSLQLPATQTLNPQGNDICISTSDQFTLLPIQWLSTTPSDGPVHEWNWQGGQANFVFQAPSLSSSATTSFLIFSGNPFATTNPDSTSVWDSNMWAVWHLQEASTPYVSSVTNAQTVTGTIPTRGAGQIGFANIFDGATTFLFPPTVSGASGGATLSALFKTTTSSGTGIIFDTRGASSCTNGSDPFIQVTSGNLVGVVNSSGFGSTAVNDGNWHHAALVVGASASTLYLDGSSVATLGSGQTFYSNIVTLGASCTGAGGWFTGSIEEIRYASSAGRSAAWIAAEASNLLHPATFVTIGLWSFTSSTGPTISAYTLAGNSPSSLLATWTTSAAASSQVLCGTATGGPYTSYSTPLLHPTQSGAAFYGVTSHSIAITGLPNNASATAYYCVVRSVDQNGNWTTSSELHAGTLAALTSTPLVMSSASPATRPNDQPGNVNGMSSAFCGNTYPGSGNWFHGDTQYSTWADDSNQYGVCQDCGATNNAHFVSGVNLVLWNDPNHLCSTWQVQAANNCAGPNCTGTPYNDSLQWDTTGVVSVNGVMYWTLARYSGGTHCCTSIVKTADHWAHSTAPQNNAGPASVGGIHLDTPTQGNQMWSREMLMGWVQVGKDNNSGGNFPVYANTDGWVYALATFSGNEVLIRVRTDDLQLQDPSKFQYYTGAQSSDDGLYDTGWSYDYTQATLLNSGISNFVVSFSKYSMTFIPDFNRFITVINPQAPGGFTAGTQVMEGQYPWSSPALAGQIPASATFPNHFPGFGQVLSATYRKTSPLPTANITLSTASGYAQNSTAAFTDYSTLVYYLGLAPRSAASLSRPSVSTNSRNGHIPSGLDLYYNFQGFGGDNVVKNLSTNDPTGLFSTTLVGVFASQAKNVAFYNQYGMDNFGWPNGASPNCCWGSNLSYTLAPPYTANSGAFTLIAAWIHWPSTVTSSSGTITIATPSGETVLSKGVTDVSIVRHGSSLNSGWDVNVMSTLVNSGGALACNDGTFCAVAIRRDASNNVTVYRSNSVESSLPLTPDASASISGSWSSFALQFGGSTSLIGSLVDGLVWNRALTDVELIHEFAVLRGDIAQRGGSLP